MKNEFTKTLEFNGGSISIATGLLAPRAESSVRMQIGETVVFTVVSMSMQDSGLDYFPLSVEYMEKFYAGGVISGSRFQKREGRPSDDATLVARQVDHSIRSLFPKGFKKDVNVIINVMAYDNENDPEAMAVFSASLALMISSIPFNGPSSSVKIGIKDGQMTVNPSMAVQDDLDSSFIVSVREGRVLNIEGFGDEVPEEEMGKLLDLAVENCEKLNAFQSEVAKEIGKQKLEYAELPVPAELIDDVKADFADRVKDGLYDRDRRNELFAEVAAELYTKHNPDGDSEGVSKGQAMEAVEYVARKLMREGVLSDEKRTSGRKLEEIRPLYIEAGVLPRVHGSALFQRGETQCMSIATLGSLRLAQLSESFEGEHEKTFIHHYHGPSYSLGEAGRVNYYAGRREVGHGHISENAFRKLLPAEEDFPYTIRVVSEILAQRGSSSMAAACGTTMALMDAGVPIKKPVAGISVGLVTNDDDISEYKLLTDIEDVEDFYGDMDFKVTGTDKGVTAIQLDNKLMGVPVAILKEAFMQSRTARLSLLEEMTSVLPAPRPNLSQYAPKVTTVRIKVDKIGELIGPGGKNIKAILEKIGGDIDINIHDDGRVDIASADQSKIDQGIEWVNGITEEPELNKIYTGVVDKVTDYGAFVDVNANISGLLHISAMSDGFVKDPRSIVNEGDRVNVKLIKIENGRLSFSMKGVAQNKPAEAAAPANNE
ncbi:MAG: Polyribonucleotide nucleotidyltransferase [candidate division WS6 bacterium OLB20]|uniref:Polyribonucleotide nucleotidyltransferase n=1 Tax=candidate division WS6 bacterium OLB20 TaxID=1617426 RepID=A0A136LVV5_9BACT|nr:MAG: Polyribonucleotide nucleotidyltransferase [candidate division WS6 bacterium OLB20]